MGNYNQGHLSETTLTCQNLLETLSPYEDIITDQYGPIQVFKQNIKPYNYFMIYSENGMDDKLTYQKLQDKLRWYKSLKSHPHVVGIEAIKLTQKAEMCIKKLSLQIYVRYYNYTLYMAIERKILLGKRFSEGDIMYGLKSLIEIWRYISESMQNKYITLFNLNNIYLSPEGYVKMYPFPIDLDFVSSPLKSPTKIVKSNSLRESQQIEVQFTPKKSSVATSYHYISSPIKSVKQTNNRDNLKDIGIILLQMIMLDKDTQQIDQLTPEQHVDRLEHQYQQGLVSTYLRNVIRQLLLRFKQTSYEKILSMIELYQMNNRNSLPSYFKLENGPECYQFKEGEKTSNLRRLSEHKNLKAGIISVMSKQRNVHQ